VRQLLNVADVRWPFDFSTYATLEDPGKKQQLLQALRAALLWLAAERGWETAPLQEAHAELLRRALIFEGFSKKSWRSPCRKRRVKIGFSHGLRSIHFFRRDLRQQRKGAEPEATRRYRAGDGRRSLGSYAYACLEGRQYLPSAHRRVLL